jgi:23S rRNA (cytidine2498-2'-O)-methyltransferase
MQMTTDPSTKILPFEGIVYQSIPGFEDHLQKELETFASSAGNTIERWGTLFSLRVPPSPPPPVFWHLNTWLEPFTLKFESINEAARALREIQRNWAPVLFDHFRRGSLIASKLPPISRKKRPFPWALPLAPMGAWTLLDTNTLLASPRCSSPFPAGLIEFEEDRAGPPSRAYLKLWESFVRLGCRPGKGERCLDAGASPGAWSWALAQLGAQVFAVDRAPLDESVSSLPGVSFTQRDVFSIKPEEIGPVDWLFSDVICYPKRLLEWVEKWLESGLCENFVCTIKMQGDVDDGVDFDTPRRFAAIPGSQVLRLCHNKHELTWMLVKKA